MLVLSRKKNQTIVIDGGIEIQILQVKGGTVRVGINAPNNVRIVRGELDVYSDMVAIDQPENSTAGVAVFGREDRVQESQLSYYTEDSAERVLAK